MTSPANFPLARFFALIPCAGNGRRAGTPKAKQYELVDGQPLVWHTVAAFRALRAHFAALWVVISPDDHDFAVAIPDFGVAPRDNDRFEGVFPLGGATRAASVLNGLKALLARPSSGALPTDWVLVHDAARCLVTPEQITALMKSCQHDAVGGLLAQKLPDTLKRELGGRVSVTIDRSDKWLAQTPQMFRIGALIDALEKAGDRVTDESSAMEAMGLSPKLVVGSAQNFKVTYPEDFALAEAILMSRRRAASAQSLTESACA